VSARCPESIISKKLTSRYKSGACKSWLKIKNPAYERRAALKEKGAVQPPLGVSSL
jgi:ATP-dependent DNA ligase